MSGARAHRWPVLVAIALVGVYTHGCVDSVIAAELRDGAASVDANDDAIDAARDEDALTASPDGGTFSFADAGRPDGDANAKDDGPILSPPADASKDGAGDGSSSDSGAD